MAENDINTDAFDATIELAAAFVSNSNHRITPDEYNGLIRSLFATLSELSGLAGAHAAEPEADTYHKSKAEIRKAVRDEGLVSFIDGKIYKSLKRHLSTQGHTPESYREKYGLPRDFPMVSPAYSARRSELAKSIGLGQKGRASRAAAQAPAAAAKTPKPRKPRAVRSEPSSAE